MIEKITFKKLPKELRSEYLDRCFPAESLNITDVTYDLEKRLATAKISVTSNFENSYEENKDNSYHWSAITAYRAVSQLAIGYLCTDIGKTKQEIGEVMQISSEIKTKKTITDKDDIPLEIKFSKYYKRGKHILGEIKYELGNGNFNGSMRFAIYVE